MVTTHVRHFLWSAQSRLLGIHHKYVYTRDLLNIRMRKMATQLSMLITTTDEMIRAMSTTPQSERFDGLSSVVR